MMASCSKEHEAFSFMENLPDEILLQIFAKLPLPDLISGVRLTCWRWYHLSNDSTLWTDVDLSAIRSTDNHRDACNIRSGVRALLHNIQDSLESLTFSDIAVDGGVYELFGSAWKRKNKAKFANLKSLNYSYSDVSPRNLRVALTTHPDIEELFLAYTKISFAQAMEEAIHLPNLKVLVYHDSQSWDSLMNNYVDHHQDEDRQINKLNVMKVPRHCSQLEVVELHTIRADFDDEVIQQFIKFCTNLRKLSFTWSTSLTSNAFSLPGSTHNITELGLLDRQETGPYLTHVLPNFPQLLRLTVNGQNVYLEDCVAIGECCAQLEELVFEINGVRGGGGMFEYYLRTGNSLCGLELQAIAQKCKNLRKLHAPYSNIDDDSVIFLSEQCLFLEDINFTQCHRLSKESLFALSKNSLCLLKVNFHENVIDHKFVLSLVTKCRRLEEIMFDHKSQESDSLPASGTSSMLCGLLEEDSDTKLSTSQSDDIPFIDMTASSEEYELQQVLLKCLSKSEERSTENEDSKGDHHQIHLPPPSHSEQLDHVSVKWIHCHLKRMSLRNSLTREQYLLDIFKQCPDLTHVCLDGSTEITNDLVITIAKSCPGVKMLGLSFSVSRKSKSNFGDEGLFALIKYSNKLEVLSFLYNCNITPDGLTALFHSLDNSFRSLMSVSLCVGRGYACSVSVVALHGLKHLTQQSKQQLRDAYATAKSSSFMLLHLDFNSRKL